MKPNTFLLVAGATLAGVVALTLCLSRPASAQEAASIHEMKIPTGYREWRMISIAHVGQPVNDLRVKLGNDLAMKAYRDGSPFPDGAIIARLAYRAVTSEKNNKVFRAAAERRGLPPEQTTKLLEGSLVAGPAINVQFMVKDSKNYAATGGWGFAQFTEGKADEVAPQTCFSCHAPAKDQDFVFTRYAP